MIEEPWICGNCAKKEVYISIEDYTVEYWKGKEINLTIPDFKMPKCRNCGSCWFSLVEDDAVNEACRLHLEK